MSYLLRNYWLFEPVYDNPEGDDPEGGDGDPPSGKVEFTEDQQKKVDEIVQTRLSRHKKQNEDIIKQLESLKEVHNLTEEEKGKLQKRIDELETITMTEKELAAKKQKEESQKFEKQLTDVTSDRDAWKDRYESSTIQREIIDAASRKETRAYNPQQIVSLLQGNTKLVEETVDGKPTGNFVARVAFNGRDSEGKMVKMDLSVPQAVEEMLKMGDLYGNLFESGLKNGLGGNNVPGNVPLSLEGIKSQEDYRKNREALKKSV